MDYLLSPRVLATQEIKSFIRTLGVRSHVRSQLTKRDGYTIRVKIDALSDNQKQKFNVVIDSIKQEHKIDRIIVLEDIPFILE